MSKNIFIDFKALKQKITIQQVLDHYNLTAILTRKGDELVGSPCPICKSQAKNVFKANTSKNSWNCFSQRHSGGNILDFVMQMEGTDKVRDAGVLIVDWFGLYKRSAQTEATKAPETSAEVKDELTINPPLSFTLKSLERDHTAIHKLGLKPDTVEHFDIGWCSKGMLKGRVAVPIHNVQGELVAYVGLPNQQDRQDKFPPLDKFNPKLELYNAHQALPVAQERGLVIVQDFIEVWRAYEHGLNAVALMNQPLTLQQVHLLSEKLSDWQEVTLVCAPADYIGDTLIALASNFAVRYVSFAYTDKHVYQLVQNMM